MSALYEILNGEVNCTDDFPVNPVEVDVLAVGDVESRRAVVLEIGAELVDLLGVILLILLQQLILLLED